VPAAIHVGNGFGKLVGVTQVGELGELETPVLLTCTLCVWKAADAMVAHLLSRPGMEDVRSINPVVGETNDGYALNAIRGRPIAERHVRAALESAAGGPVAEGSVGAGTGTVAFGWKGGIGTSSRRVRQPGDDPAATWTVGVLVQTNYGGVLQVAGVPVGQALGQYYLKDELSKASGDGSCIVVVATDAPLSDRNLERLAHRGLLGIARTGSPMTNGSGEYAIAFSTNLDVRRTPERRAHPSPIVDLPNESMSPLFEAAVEAAEEAAINSLFAATSMDGNGHHIDALPIDQVIKLYRRARRQ
jgi:D-aminopeptidase